MLAFPGLVLVAADVDHAWVHSWMRDEHFARPMAPPFLDALEDVLRREADCLDAVLLAEPVPGDPPPGLHPVGDSSHPRVLRAVRYRCDVRVWCSPYRVLIIGRGLAGRWEVAIEVGEEARNKGHGRELVRAARHLVPDGRPVWAQIAPGDAGSLRAFPAAGYEPVGSEILLVPPSPRTACPPAVSACTPGLRRAGGSFALGGAWRRAAVGYLQAEPGLRLRCGALAVWVCLLPSPTAPSVSP